MGHDHDHDHGHGHGHDHGHELPADHGRAFLIGIALNVTIVVLEVVYGLMSHSMALVADAGHNLSDVLGLVLALAATVLAKRKPTARRTYGFRKSSILAALANATLLLVVTGGVVWESIQRIRDPGIVHEKTVMIVAGIAMLINGASALLFLRGGKHDLNVRSAFLHLAGDAAIALGVVASGAVILFTGYYRLDPIVSILVSVLILVSTWSLLRRSLDLVLDAVPEGVDPDKVRAYLCGLPDVIEVHDLHIWAMSTTETALTAHLVMNADSRDPSFLGDVSHGLSHRFNIAHATVQIETADAPRDCHLAAEITSCQLEGKVA
jgi:cobalt-zinc-cadmium efflux system protein